MIAVYARVSTEEQARKGYSLSDQVKECRKSADEKAAGEGAAGEKAKIQEYIDEGVSGEILDRPALTALRKDVREGMITKVICLDPDRLSRKLMNQLILSEELEKRVKLVFVNGEYRHTPEGKLFYQMRGAISEFEKAKINERFCRGRKEKARQGKVIRDYQIYGYDYDRASGQMTVNAAEAEVVRLIYYLFTAGEPEGKGINGIAAYLNQLGIPTKRGARSWHRQVVRQLLMNRSYIGEFYQNRWNTEGMLTNRFRPTEEKVRMKLRPPEEWIMVPCIPIIEKEAFAFAQELLQQSRRRWAGQEKRSYLLSGLLRCGDCGNTMTGRLVKNWGKEALIYTDRKNTAGAANPGCGRSISTGEADNLVWEAVLNRIKGRLNEQITDRLKDQLKDQIVNGDFMQAGEGKKKEEAGNGKVWQYQERAIQQNYIEKKLQELRQGRQNLIGFLASGKSLLDGQELEEAGAQLKRLADEEKPLRLHLENILKSNRTQLKENADSPQEDYDRLCGKALHYYMNIHPEELSFADKKNLIRYLVKEIVLTGEEINLMGF